MISEGQDGITVANGTNMLDILGKMAQRMPYYDKNSDFQESYKALLEEYEPFTET